ncbi:CatA-like O-acetyltransferase, family 2 [Frisingicoccus sp.]|uniref:CatA-like O-acetyltransferase, family 2 n=1 Tax=Frisingicoccus sp. TaxID=1918627 RepID=UPI00399B03EA
MVKEIDPKQTKRAMAFEMWMKAPMPMVTLFKTLDVTHLIKMSRKYGYKFNMLMCWCIGKAATQTEEFYMLPVGDKMMQYNRIAVNTVVTTKDGDINTCDVPFSDDLEQFNRDYLYLTGKVHDTCDAYDLGEDYMVIGTSVLAGYDIDGAVNIYAGFYNNPFMIWGKYRKRFFKTTLPVSFQFHHTQMDGVPAAQFLECLQRVIHSFGV